jgi:hypothetical protein
MKVSRNETCPCGSGSKYKACCGKGEKTRTGVASGRIIAIIIGVVVVAGVAIAVNQLRTTDLGVQPYVYDAKNDRYFDPVHGHMHEGRPPQGAAQQDPTAALPGSVPAAWDYDATKNQHYDPQHGHWHAGPPPNQAGNPLTLPSVGGVPFAPSTAPITVPTNVPDDGSPPAWDYDAENDRHWNPNTSTWDSGMPPIEAFTSDDGN